MTDLYESQRAMRAMRRAAIQRGVIAILDVGTSKIACLILRFDGRDRMPEGEGIGNMAGQSQFRVIGAATTRSRGVALGESCAMQETERAVRTAVQAAQKMANVRVDHVIACLSGGQPRSYGLAGQVLVEGDTVREADVARVLAACDIPDYGAEREVLHAQPVNFALDHRSGLIDPREQIGQRLACDMHMLTVDTAVVQNLIYCLKRCDLELAGLASSAYVSGIAALVEDEQELGAACIDMGGGTTGLSIFMKKHMIYADTVRLGGEHITSDISKGLQVSMAVAERIKTFHGGVVATGMDDREMIEIGGETEESGEANASIAAELPTAAMLILLLLVGQFNSLRRPAIILSTIPLGLVGVTFGLLIANSSFGFFTLLGLISLSGIIINNAIVLLDRIAIELREFGRSQQEAILHAAQQRFRPILLTTATTVLGMTPLLWGGTAMFKPMAITIIFGLAFATALTLLVVPVLYSILFRVSFRN